MINYTKIAAMLDKVANSLEELGDIKSAYEIDKITDTIEAMAKFPPEVVQLAQELGIRLTPETAAKIVAEHYDPKSEQQLKQELSTKEAMKVSMKAKKLALLAMLLANTFLSQVRAEKLDKPIIVNIPGFEGKGRQEYIYTPDDLEQLKKRDPKTYAVIMDLYYKQQAQGELAKERREFIRRQQEKTQKGQPATMKKVKRQELLHDEFGNTATFTIYEDGSKELLGDIIENGRSLRTTLEKAGEIKVDPTAERVTPPRC